MNSAPLVHVIVINWNGLEHLEACFDSLLALDYPAFQAVLTDNGSADGSVAFAREKWGDDPRFSALELGANLGWSGGNNAALRQAIVAGARYALL
ncbi:MAG TPA: glycosyltransferase, partial [Candidatus Hydrogenedentes bacterium]|nr:glycosyltransferase [Candidatus Hydrogenedentota bacterium]